MRARHQFPSEERYLEYLKFYYAGLAMQALIPVWNADIRDKKDDIVNESLEISNHLIKKLNDEKAK